MKPIKLSKKLETSILLKDYISNIYYSNDTITVKFTYPSEISGGGVSQYTQKSNSEADLKDYEGNFNDFKGKSQENEKRGFSNFSDQQPNRANHCGAEEDNLKKIRQTKYEFFRVGFVICLPGHTPANESCSKVGFTVMMKMLPKAHGYYGYKMRFPPLSPH